MLRCELPHQAWLFPAHTAMRRIPTADSEKPSFAPHATRTLLSLLVLLAPGAARGADDALAFPFGTASGRLAIGSTRGQQSDDAEGRPVILGLSSGGHAPGPDNDPRLWEITRWTGERWLTSTVTQSDHNYDSCSLYVNGERWTVIGPTLTGPQAYFTGGEVGLWVSTDRGASWNLERRVTQNSPMNHSYVRRPPNPADPFFAVWADGDSSRLSPSRIFFSNSTGDRLYMLPYRMDADYAEPVLLAPPIPPPADVSDFFQTKNQ